MDKLTKFIEDFLKECKAEAKEMGFDSVHDAVAYLRKKQESKIKK